MFCSTCGSKVEDNAAYCPVCGSKLIGTAGNTADSAFSGNTGYSAPSGNSVFGYAGDSAFDQTGANEYATGGDSAFAPADDSAFVQQDDQYGRQDSYRQDDQYGRQDSYRQNDQYGGQDSYRQNDQYGGQDSYRQDDRYGRQNSMHQGAETRDYQADRPRNDRPRNDRPRNDRPRNERPQQNARRNDPPRRDDSRRDNPKKQGMDKKTKTLFFISIAAAVVLAIIVGIVAVRTFRKDKPDIESILQEASTNAEGEYVDEEGNVITEDEVIKRAQEKEKADKGKEKGDDKDFTHEVAYMPRPSIINDYMLVSYKPIEASVPNTASDNLGNLDNYDLIDYMPEDEKDMLLKNQFVVTDGWDCEFFEGYEYLRYDYRPAFVTVDSIMHTYHLYFAHVLKNTEKTYLIDDVTEMSRLMQQKSKAQYDVLKGTEWELAAWRNLAFFTVGYKLANPDAEVPAEVQDVVQKELDLIEQAGGVTQSPLFDDPENMEDYSQYIPRGYYDTDENLKKYFKTMMWYGRRNFARKDEDQDRSALLMTLAMDNDTLPLWEEIYTITSFFAGASDDCGYYEYRPIIDKVYGADITADKLPGNDKAWTEFHDLTGQLPAPKINSVVVLVDDTDEEKEAKINGFRFMGQRFSIDEAIFQNLCYSRVKENSSNQARMLPNALDVPAAMGSDVALDILKEQGVEDYKGYSENMESLRTMVKEAPDSTWNSSLYSEWLNTLRPVLEERGEGYPVFMQSQEWRKKNLVTFLGSYTELKHDTILYSKQMMAEMGDGPIPERDDRGYVEPEPEVYARLTALVKATSEGLQHYDALRDADKENLALLADITTKLQAISEKELTNVLPTDEEFEFIRSYGGQIEHFWQEVNKEEAGKDYFTTEEFPAAIVADVATDPNGACLELGTGRINTIMVIIEVDGVKKVAWGGVYSFYQFQQPINDRLTDSKWRQMLGIELREDGTYNYDRESQPKQEAWTKSFRYESK
ncbi:MAG: DUF3160 domain-containing protein [Eubacterium sp.]|nr:DUF3160 domain-containing protein [Eubacterium sp.]